MIASKHHSFVNAFSSYHFFNMNGTKNLGYEQDCIALKQKGSPQNNGSEPYYL
jgi:hypothetical protein